jgi:benzoate-CoA ligase family protein
LIDRVSDGLSAEGVRKGDRIILALPDSIEFVVAFFAAVQIGLIAVPVNIYQSSEDFGQIVTKISPRLILTHPYSEPINKALESLPSRSKLAIVDVADTTSIWPEWLRERTVTPRGVYPNQDEVAFLLWTSGTTGRCIPVPHRQSDCDVCCRHYAAKILAATPEDVFFSTSRMFHAYGLGNSVLFPLFAGARSVLLSERPTPKATLKIARDTNATILFSVPTFFGMMNELAGREKAPVLPKLRLAISAAEPLAATTLLRWQSLFGVDILDGVGSTEALHIYLSSRSGEVIPGSAGKAVPGYDLALRADDRLAKKGEVGTLWLRGDSVALGYWNEPVATANAMVDGWFITGDRFYQDDAGYYYFVGRADSMFRISGKWVSAIEIEAALAEHSSVKEICVVAYLDEHGFSRLYGFIVTHLESPDNASVEAELRELAEYTLPIWKRPTQYQFIEALPRTATGKVQRYLLRAGTRCDM